MGAEDVVVEGDLNLVTKTDFGNLQQGFDRNEEGTIAGNLKDYVDWSIKEEKNEALASFVGMVTEGP